MNTGLISGVVWLEDLEGEGSGWKVGQIGEGGEGKKGWSRCWLKSLDFI